MSAATQSRVDLAWVDEFIRNVRPYIYVREEDNILIRMPNQAQRLNDTGVRILKYLLDGGTAGGLAASLKNESQLEEAALFLSDVRRSLSGTLNEFNHSRAVEVKPLALGFSKLPVLAEVALTSRCNLGCVFCYYGCPTKSKTAAGHLSKQELGIVFQMIYREAKAPSLSFTGGEPTLRPDLPELVSMARETGLRVNLISNGTLITPDLADRLAGAGLNSAQISLEGTSAATHDLVTQTPGSFRRAVDAVRLLQEREVTVHTNTTLNRLNLGDAPGMPRFVSQSLGLERFSMNMIIPSGAAVEGPGRLLLTYSEVGATLESLLKASAQWDVEFMWYSPTPICIFNPIVRGLGNKGCAACDGLLSVDCNGDVLPCSSWSEPVGNLIEDGFVAVWKSSRAAAIRGKAEAPPGCSECDSFAVCHGACPLYWRRFGYGELGKASKATAAGGMNHGRL